MSQTIEPVKDFDPEKYLGKWYEIARYDHRFERNCENVTAEYSIKGKAIGVKNTCVKPDKTNSIEGKAFIKDRTKGALKVQFFWPFRSNYWVILLDEEYSYAVVSEPGKRYLWVLSRNKTLSEENHQLIKDFLIEKGFDLKSLIYVKQE